MHIDVVTFQTIDQFHQVSFCITDDTSTRVTYFDTLVPYEGEQTRDEIIARAMTLGGHIIQPKKGDDVALCYRWHPAATLRQVGIETESWTSLYPIREGDRVIFTKTLTLCAMRIRDLLWDIASQCGRPKDRNSIRWLSFPYAMCLSGLRRCCARPSHEPRSVFSF